MTHKGTVPLEMERLFLRRFTLADADAMFRNTLRDPEVPVYMTWSVYQTIDAARDYIASIVDGYGKTSYHWAIVIKETGEPVGSIGVGRYNDQTRSFSIGYSIGSNWWRRGYMTEALRELVRFFFEEVGANRIEAQHDVRNPNSGKVMQKAGLRYEGTSRQSEHNNQGIHDEAHYAILASDYFAAKANAAIADVTAENYTRRNAEIIGNWTDAGWLWGTPISHEVYADALRGKWDVLLTPTKFVPHDWFPELRGSKLLGLASAGGQQMPVFAALGANCTVFDISEKMLDKDREVMVREGLALSIVQGDMTKRLPFDDASFDVIFHPVSNCYVEDVRHVWRECFRILKSGGVLLAGLDNGTNFLFDTYDRPLTIRNTYPFNPLKNVAQMKKLLDDDDGIQFSHSIEEQIGGQLEAGFTLTHVFEDFDTGADAGDYPGYWATRAVK
ncbi:MAG: GNAT family N-acetyltransferase [Oscillospiraceae bacterium]|jgi:RimJ/RimL family protein N-acetyltransferase/SAM-dependent methyltransferase|nr:GNAT family N-acetyltransferase [Oscillospiraceae bacterium]